MCRLTEKANYWHRGSWHELLSLYFLRHTYKRTEINKRKTDKPTFTETGSRLSLKAWKLKLRDCWVAFLTGTRFPEHSKCSGIPSITCGWRRKEKHKESSESDWVRDLALMQWVSFIFVHTHTYARVHGCMDMILCLPTSISLLRATSEKFSCSSRVLSILSSVMQ